MFLGFLLSLSACAALKEHGKERRFYLAQKDHVACTDRGFDFPSEKYRKCRLRQLDKREEKLWMEMQLAQRSTGPNTNEIFIPNTPNRIEQYRPISEEHFECEIRFRDDTEYIYCDTH